MKFTLVAFLLVATFAAKSQTVVIADPGLNGIYTTDLAGVPIDANVLVINNPILLKIGVLNTNPDNAIPPGTARIKIGLGSKMMLDPSFSLATADLSVYFSWSYGFEGGQPVITGDIIAEVPADLIAEASFRVIPNVLNTSTVTGNFLVTNNNPSYILGDESGTNNTAQLIYTVVAAPLPVDITEINLLKKGCNVTVNWHTENELNVNRYEIEASTDGVNYTKVATVTAVSRTTYNTEFSLTEALRGSTLFIRIKSVDQDGSAQYSFTKTTSGICDNKLLFNIYPNPVRDQAVVLKATSGLFNGKYRLTVIDMAGRIIHSKETMINNTAQYRYDLAGLSSGKYFLRVALTDGTDTSVLPFEKL